MNVQRQLEAALGSYLPARTFPGHDRAAVVVNGWAFRPNGEAFLTAVVLDPQSREARAVIARPDHFSIYRDERLPR